MNARYRLSAQLLLLFVLPFLLTCTPCTRNTGQSKTQGNPLPSWNNGTARQAILDFVNSAIDSSSADFIPVRERITVFDNDGTLWSEQPAYFQFYFTRDHVKQLAAGHPEWSDIQPYKSILEGNMDSTIKYNPSSLLTFSMLSKDTMTDIEFARMARQWIDTARNPQTGMLLKAMVYQPMVELLHYLRANDFKTYIVSGGSLDLMRQFTGELYGIPPEQVIGSTVKTQFRIKNGIPEILRLPEMDYFNDKQAKPLAIDKFIGLRPVAAFGNSDGDLAMLQWTAAGPRKPLMVFIHHTDREREWAYDRESHIGRLDKGLDVAAAKGWTVVDMKKDWKSIFSSN